MNNNIDVNSLMTINECEKYALQIETAVTAISNRIRTICDAESADRALRLIAPLERERKLLNEVLVKIEDRAEALGDGPELRLRWGPVTLLSSPVNVGGLENNDESSYEFSLFEEEDDDDEDQCQDESDEVDSDSESDSSVAETDAVIVNIDKVLSSFSDKPILDVSGARDRDSGALTFQEILSLEKGVMNSHDVQSGRILHSLEDRGKILRSTQKWVEGDGQKMHAEFLFNVSRDRGRVNQVSYRWVRGEQFDRYRAEVSQVPVSDRGEPDGPKDGGMGGFNPYGNGQTASFGKVLSDLSLLAEQYQMISHQNVQVNDENTRLQKQLVDLRQMLEVERAKNLDVDKTRSKFDEMDRVLQQARLENAKLRTQLQSQIDFNAELEVLLTETHSQKESSSVQVESVEERIPVTLGLGVNQILTTEYNSKGRLLDVARACPQTGTPLFSYSVCGESHNLTHSVTGTWAGYKVTMDSRTKKDGEAAVCSELLRLFGTNASSSSSASVLPLPPIPAKREPVLDGSAVLPSDCRDWLVNCIRERPGQSNTEIKTKFSRVFTGRAGEVNITLHNLLKEGRVRMIESGAYKYWYVN